MTLCTIAGEMSDCPGYLSVVINDRSASEQLFHYDVMTSCPSNFNLTFTVPRTSSSRHSTLPQVKTFEVLLDDAKREQRLLLTYFRSSVAAEDDGNAAVGVLAEAYSSKVVRGHTNNVTKVVVGCVLTVVICLSVRLMCDVTMLRREKPSVTGDDVIQQCGAGNSVSRPEIPPEQRRHLVFISIYVGVSVVYSVLVTFNAVSAMFLFHFRSDIDHVTGGGQLLGELTRRAVADVERVSEECVEMELELAERRLRQVPVACTQHIDDTAQAVNQSIIGQNRPGRLRNSTSVSNVMSTVINSTLSEVQQRMLKYVANLDQQFERRADPVRLHHGRFRHQVANNAWLMFARSLFNRSASLTPASAATLNEDAVMRFLIEMLSIHMTSHLPRSYSPARLKRLVKLSPVIIIFNYLQGVAQN